MRLENGDRFERQNAQWLRLRLPSYEPVWQEFIGNDGSSHPLKLANVKPEDAKVRHLFFQSHYSMAYSAKRIVELMDGLEEIIVNSKAEHSLHRQFDFLFYLLSRIGHVRDMLGTIDAALKMGGTAVNPFQEFYHQRSHLTHGPQMPFDVRDDIVYIPPIAGANPTRAEWDDSKAWEQMNPGDFVPISDYCEKIIADFFELLTSVHQKIYAAAKKRYQGCKLETPEAESSDSFRERGAAGAASIPLSANISGQYWGPK